MTPTPSAIISTPEIKKPKNLQSRLLKETMVMTILTSVRMENCLYISIHRASVGKYAD
jgi:hypothetical protein